MAIQRYEIFPPSGGLQTKDSAYYIDDMQTPDMLDMDLSEVGKVKTRLGKTLYAEADSSEAKIVAGQYIKDSVHAVLVDKDIWVNKDGVLTKAQYTVDGTPTGQPLFSNTAYLGSIVDYKGRTLVSMLPLDNTKASNMMRYLGNYTKGGVGITPSFALPDIAQLSSHTGFSIADVVWGYFRSDWMGINTGVPYAIAINYIGYNIICLDTGKTATITNVVPYSGIYSSFTFSTPATHIAGQTPVSGFGSLTIVILSPTFNGKLTTLSQLVWYYYGNWRAGNPTFTPEDNGRDIYNETQNKIMHITGYDSTPSTQEFNRGRTCSYVTIETADFAQHNIFSIATPTTDYPAEWGVAGKQPNLLCYHGIRMWALSVYSGILYWSKRYMGGDYDFTAEWRAVVPWGKVATAAELDLIKEGRDAGSQPILQADSDWATGLASQQSGLVVFKERSINRIIGSQTTPDGYQTLYREFGCVAPKSIVVVDNKVIFLSKHKGVYQVRVLDDGNGITELSDGIKPTLNQIYDDRFSVLTTTSAEVFGDKYILTYLTKIGDVYAYKVLKLNYKTGAWELCNGNIASAHYYVAGDLYGCGFGNTNPLNPNEKMRIYKLETSTNDNDVTIPGYFKTKDFVLAGSELMVQLKYLCLWCKASGNYKLNINIYHNGKKLPQTYKMDLGTRGSSETIRFESLPIDTAVQGGNLAIKLSTAEKDQSFEFYRGELLYEVVGKAVN